MFREIGPMVARDLRRNGGIMNRNAPANMASAATSLPQERTLRNTRAMPWLIRACIVLATVALAGTALGGDTMVAASVKTDGTFEGFENGRILFRNAKGRLLRQQNGLVSKLTLESPRSVWITLKGTRKTQDKAICKGFEKSKFIFEESGKIATTPADRIVKIELCMDDLSDDQAGRSITVEEIDTDALIAGLGGQTPTLAQSAAIKKYKEARQNYDRFTHEISELKDGLNGAAGSKRVAILDQLRTKKHEELGILDALGKAEDMLTSAFPSLAQ